MEKSINEFIDNQFYYSATDNCVFSITSDRHMIGYCQLEEFIRKAFYLKQEDSFAIISKWLLSQGVRLREDVFNTRYVSYETDIGDDDGATTTTYKTDEFKYKYELIYHD